MLNKITKYLSSTRFTILLICLLGLMFIIGLWVPQKNLLKTIYIEWQRNAPGLVAFLDALGLTSIYSSPITITLWLLFFLNLSLVLWQRMPLVKSRIAISDAKITDPVTSGGYPFRGSYPLPVGLNGDTVIAMLRKCRYTVLGDAAGFYGVRNRLAPIAFMFFHLSFFLILLGGLINLYTKFTGYVDLAQGESFQGELERYNQKPWIKLPKIGSPPNVSFTIQSIVPQVVGDTATGISIKLVDAGGKSHDVGINTPYNTDYSSFVFINLGVAPLFVLMDPEGREIGGSYFKLNVIKGNQDNFRLGDFVITARFYPDYVLEQGQHLTKTQEFNNPTFFLTVERDRNKIAESVVPKNGSMVFGGYRLEMREMPYWVRFYVNKQRGISIVYLGFAIASIAIIWRLLFYKREIIGAVRDQDGVRCLVVAGRSEYYKSLAEDEFEKMFGEIVGLKAVER
ncbi:MAG: cytochrome c biogenesis protein ResB [Deltaproteobacteria bacterium]